MVCVCVSFSGSRNDIIPGPSRGQKKTEGNEGVSREGSEGPGEMEKQREKLRRKEQEQMQRKSKKTEKMAAATEGASEQ